jgi:stearoyl-CoA desaturase (delta-9 desaturase)
MPGSRRYFTILTGARRAPDARPLGSSIVIAILVFLVSHWAVSVFFQSFFHHRYGAHRMFTLSRFWERFFYVCTYLAQGSSFLSVRGYAIMHREHHAFSDTARDPHSPQIHPSPLAMVLAMLRRYSDLTHRRAGTEPRFEGGYPEWTALERLGDSWVSRIGFGIAYTLFYLAFAPHWAWYLLLPIHYVMSPIHGTIVNWAGHKYGYRNFAATAESPRGKTVPDASRNALAVDFVTMGELLQNNHHHRAASPNFAARWFEIDPSYQGMRVLAWLGILKWRAAAGGAARPVAAVPSLRPAA